MSVTADTLRLHFDYSAWASRRLMEAAAKCTPEELARDFKTSDKNILDTLVHVFAADRIWLSRVEGAPRSTFIDATDREFAVLDREWPVLYGRWKEWLAPLTDDGARAKIAYRDMKGNPYEQPLWQILLHVVNHGTHHRGQAAGFLRALGYTPPPLDLIAFYRQICGAG